MKNFLIAIALLAPLGCAQPSGDPERPAPPANAPAKKGLSAVARRLEFVNWDPQQKQLTWFVSVWDLESDMSVPADLERYVIHVNSGVMESDGKQRPFQVPEPDLQALMNILSSYTMRSTIWWGRAGTNDSGDPPALVPESQDGPKDKNRGGKPDEKITGAPAGKAAVVSMPSIGCRGEVSPLAIIR